VWTKLPLVPVIVRTKLPLAAFFGAVTVSVELPDPDTDAGLNEALARAGTPLTLKATLPVNPFRAAMVTV
jgi:hypothetical protein